MVNVVNPLESNEELNIFKLVRIARNLKVKDLAKELQVSTAYINAIESGTKYPAERLLRDYAIALDVDETVIRTFKPENQGSHKFEHVLLSLLKMICDIEDE